MTKPVIEKKYYSGMSGLALPMPKYRFPEEFQKSTRLTYYASINNSIEINKSFYALPNGKTLIKWANEVPDHFKFTFKLWKQITHAKNLKFEESDVSNFMEAINHVGNKKGCLLIQFPASIKSDSLLQLQNLLHVIKSHNTGSSWNVAIEFRDRSWYNAETYEIAEAYDAALVIHDKSRAMSPHVNTNIDTVYLRFHGPRGDYRGTYDNSFLDEYATYVREWLSDGKSVFVYFNNTMGSAYENLMTLNEFVNG